MHISLDWLRQYVDWDASVEELENLLTRTGISVESITTTGVAIDQVVVAQISSSDAHPNADRLSVCQVDDGSGEPRQIVCGAKNYKVGDKVPLALPGAVLPGDFKIKVGKLRGVKSEGMMCSGKELGLSDDHGGLYILPGDATVGKPVSELFPDDTVLEVEITPNRPDWLSHVGVAREVGAFARKEIRLPQLDQPMTARDETLARNDAEQACPLYTVRRISNVKVGPSPDWLRARLEAVGLRSINNVVDITNFVMYEFGQPLHAFDAAKVKGGICVRMAAEGEKFVTLDGQERTLSQADLVIADAGEPIALAGVMGGEHSGVTAETSEILLESAYFTPAGIRRTSRRHELSSDSSYRFERGVDPEGILTASARATELILELASGEAAPEVIATGTPEPFGRIVNLRPERCRKVLGVELPDTEIAYALARFGLTDAGTNTWRIPSFRGDLEREIDLIEEVARLVGMEAIPSRVAGAPAHSSDADLRYDFEMEFRNRLRGMAFYEARTSTLTSPEKSPGGVKLRNPMGVEQSVLRGSLIPGLVDAVERNLRHGAAAIRLYELGDVYSICKPEQRKMLALAVTGEARHKTWLEQAREASLFDLKGAISSLLSGAVSFAPSNFDDLVLGLQIALAGRVIGRVGQLSPAAAKRIDARGPVVVAEIEMRAFGIARGLSEQIAALPKFPATSRDLALVLPRETSYLEVEAVIARVDEPLLVGCSLFDVFVDDSGEKLPKDRKSLAISLTFQSPEKTLTADEAATAADKIQKALEEKLNAELRG